MPRAARSPEHRPVELSTVWRTELVRSQISTGLCSTQPARGISCWCSSWCLPISSPAPLKIMHRVLVVPWSIAATKSAMSRVLSGVGTPDRGTSVAYRRRWVTAGGAGSPELTGGLHRSAGAARGLRLEGQLHREERTHILQRRGWRHGGPGHDAVPAHGPPVPGAA